MRKQDKRALYESIMRNISVQVKRILNEEEKEKELTPEEKMDAWHNGERKENIKACFADKLKMYRDICKKKGYKKEEAELQKEIDKRGLKDDKVEESYLFEYNGSDALEDAEQSEWPENSIEYEDIMANGRGSQYFDESPYQDGNKVRICTSELRKLKEGLDVNALRDRFEQDYDVKVDGRFGRYQGGKAVYMTVHDLSTSAVTNALQYFLNEEEMELNAKDYITVL